MGAMAERSIGKTSRTVKRSPVNSTGRGGRRVALVFAFFVALLWAGAVWGRPYLRERWYNFRDARMHAELPEAVTYQEVEQRTTSIISAGVPIPRSVSEPELSLRGAPGDEAIPSNPEIASSSPIAPPRNDNSVVTTTKPAIAAAVNLKIPFVSQAPHRNWDMPYQEACEEASAIMASLYYQGDTRDMVIGDAGDALLKKVIAWEEERFGYYKDTTVAETVVMLEEYFKLRARIVDNPTVEDIKEAVAAGHPVLVPAYGKALPNPYFKNGGPLYHMLVVKGYTETKFITNDPGTNTRGAEFTYVYDALMNAIHDWNGGDVPHGAKRIIIVEGPSV